MKELEVWVDATSWTNGNIQFHQCCAHKPSGNGIVEWCQRMVKQIATQKNSPIMEAVYWYNITPISTSSIPIYLLHLYKTSVKGVDVVPSPSQVTLAWYKEGDAVWVKNLQR